MAHGINLKLFDLHRIPTPDWTVQGQSFDPALTEELRQRLALQQPSILQQVEVTLRWALTDPDAIRQLQHLYSYAEKVRGAYFIGRQYFELESGDIALIETECCLLSLNNENMSYVHERYTVTLRYDIISATGTYILARETQRESVLAKLDIHRLGTANPSEMLKYDANDCGPEWLSWMTNHWEIVLEIIDRCATEAVDDGSFSGELDYNGFPSRLSMTGEFIIDNVRPFCYSSDRKGFSAMLRFQEHPYVAEQKSYDYLENDLDIFVNSEGEFYLDSANTSSI